VKQLCYAIALAFILPISANAQTLCASDWGGTFCFPDPSFSSGGGPTSVGGGATTAPAAPQPTVASPALDTNGSPCFDLQDGDGKEIDCD
jgi:hypothetical protein